MNNDEQTLRASLQAAQQQVDGPAPDFATTFAAAERQAEGRRKLPLAGLATAAAVAVLAFGLLPTAEDEYQYVDVDELVASTTWTAPSDSLLPKHQFDIYRDLPTLFESTKSDEGALL